MFNERNNESLNEEQRANSPVVMTCQSTTDGVSKPIARFSATENTKTIRKICMERRNSLLHPKGDCGPGFILKYRHQN